MIAILQKYCQNGLISVIRFTVFLSTTRGVIDNANRRPASADAVHCGGVDRPGRGVAEVVREVAAFHRRAGFVADPRRTHQRRPQHRAALRGAAVPPHGDHVASSQGPGKLPPRHPAQHLGGRTALPAPGLVRRRTRNLPGRPRAVNRTGNPGVPRHHQAGHHRHGLTQPLVRRPLPQGDGGAERGATTLQLIIY